MANPRQRRKTRSSHKPVHHSRQAKKILKKQPPVRGPKLLQEAWDKHKTVRQNYAALGLAVSLNPNTAGGVECAAAVTEARTAANEATSIDASGPSVSTSGGIDRDIPQGFGRIVRDEHGRVIAVDANDDEQPSSELMELVEDRAAGAALAPESQSWISLGRGAGAEKPQNEVLRELDDVFPVRMSRFSSKSEVAYLRRLVTKHGRDVEAMARDRRLNPDQRTGGELNRAVKKAGGFEKLGGSRSLS
ncbi:ribosome biogenesis protein Nop16 [Gloeopeniophorella convolvens]|nr:ribosome biogenesis protein Nop16 [Gloeopeniophorella convolvens]